MHRTQDSVSLSRTVGVRAAKTTLAHTHGSGQRCKEAQTQNILGCQSEPFTLFTHLDTWLYNEEYQVVRAEAKENTQSIGQGSNGPIL